MHIVTPARGPQVVLKRSVRGPQEVCKGSMRGPWGGSMIVIEVFLWWFSRIVDVLFMRVQWGVHKRSAIVTEIPQGLCNGSVRVIQVLWLFCKGYWGFVRGPWWFCEGYVMVIEGLQGICNGSIRSPWGGCDGYLGSVRVPSGVHKSSTMVWQGYWGSVSSMQWLLRFDNGFCKVPWGFYEGSTRGLWWLLRFHKAYDLQGLLRFCNGSTSFIDIMCRVHDGSARGT